MKPTPIKNLTLLILLTQEKSRCTGPNKESYERVVPEDTSKLGSSESCHLPFVL